MSLTGFKVRMPEVARIDNLRTSALSAVREADEYASAWYFSAENLWVNVKCCTRPADAPSARRLTRLCAALRAHEAHTNPVPFQLAKRWWPDKHKDTVVRVMGDVGYGEPFKATWYGCIKAARAYHALLVAAGVPLPPLPSLCDDKEDFGTWESYWEDAADRGC
jgi:hypothetical protein